jgi:hypothetical protein
LPLCARWNPDGITFANEIVIGLEPSSLFVDRNNTVYVGDHLNGHIHVWRDDSTTVMRTIFNTSRTPDALFVNIDGDIYVGSQVVRAVEKWGLNTTNSIVVMIVDTFCFGLFIDIANHLYCSSGKEDRVVKQSLDDDENMLSTVAGTGYPGSTSDMLNQPHGIFIDINFDLYVADCGNDRVQLFKFEQLNGITVAGKDATLSIALDCPTAVFLDTNSNLFIVDGWTHRIIGSTPNGFYCVVGCPSVRSSASNQLNYPTAAAFDNYGNIFVADRYNNRIQKFILITNTSSK